MKRTAYIIATAAICFIATAKSNIDGWWKGEIFNIPMAIFVDSDAQRVSFYSPTQTDQEIPCDVAKIYGDTIEIGVTPIGLYYHAVYEDDTIAGTFSQGQIVRPLSMVRADESAARSHRPQDPKPPFMYSIEDVTFTNGDITLAGTLTRPYYGRHGAVVLVSGSGAQNRDEEILGHKPFAVIADYLTRSGWAVLRYDDRGVGGSSVGSPDDTTLDFAGDAMAAVRYLRTRPEIDPNRIGILGHSEGGLIGFINAAEHPSEINFIISLAGPAVKGRDVMIRQNEMIAELNGSEIDPASHAQLEEVFDTIVNESDTAAIYKRLKEIALSRGATESQAEASAKIMTTPWYIQFVRTDPSQYISRIAVPVLALGGEWDIQVDAAQNLGAIKKLLPAATTKTYPRLNHLFQPSDNRQASFNYGAIATTIDPAVLTDIANFLFGVGR